MKTIAALRAILDSVPWSRVNAHVHTHLCDGQQTMTVENIGAEAKRTGVALVVLTPHFHKRVSDETETLYEDSSVDILIRLREELDAYEARGGNTKFLLSTEADILSQDGSLSLPTSPAVEQALDLISPTLNYHPLLPLSAVHLTYGRDIDGLHERGEYARMAKAAGGIPAVLEALYATEAQALLRAPYPAMLGHFFAAHSVANDRYNWFGAQPEHLPIMKAGAEKLLAACRKTGAMIDVTGIHPKNETALHKQRKDGFLFEYQKWFLLRCGEEDIPAYPGSDAHGLSGVGDLWYYRESFDKIREDSFA